MITSIVGRLIKKPEVAERIQIPGKHVVNFTLVENRNRGEKRLSVFFNLSLIIGTDAQFDLAMRLDKGTVLLFSSPRITYVRQSDKSETEQTINLYAEADNFKIVAGAGEGSAGSAGALAAGGAGDNFFAPSAFAPSAFAPSAVTTATPPPSRAVASNSGAARGAATDLSDLSGLDDADDPFAEPEPAPVRSGSPRGGSGARSAAAPPQPATASSAGRPRAERPQPSAPPVPRPSASGPATAARSPIAAPPPMDEDRGEDMGEDMADLSDPFAESDL